MRLRFVVTNIKDIVIKVYKLQQQNKISRHVARKLYRREPVTFSTVKKIRQFIPEAEFFLPAESKLVKGGDMDEVSSSGADSR